MKNKILLLVCLVATGAWAADLRIVPYPRKTERLDGRMALRGTVMIAVASNDAEDRFAAGLLKEEIESTGAKARVSSGAYGQIVLTRRNASADLGDEGYT